MLMFKRQVLTSELWIVPTMFSGYRSIIFSFAWVLLLFLTVSTLKSLLFYIVLPTCTIPGFRQTNFCTIITRPNASVEFLPPQKVTTVVCNIPLVNRFFPCPKVLPQSLNNRISDSLDSQFIAYQELVASTLATPVFGREIRDIVLSLDDMVVLLKATSFKNKEAIMAHLGSLRRASRESARRLQKYTAKLLSSITLILTSSEFTIEVARNSDKSVPWNLWWPPTSTQDVQAAFLHTIKTFDSLNRHLTHLNGETQEAITILDGYIEVLVDLIYDEALVDANQELGEILSRFWTRLGGHRTRLLDAKERVETLTRVGQGTGDMRAFVLDVQLRLERLQTGADELRARAAEPLLVGGPIPVTNIVESLKEGCKSLKDELWSTSSRLQLDNPV